MLTVKWIPINKKPMAAMQNAPADRTLMSLPMWRLIRLHCSSSCPLWTTDSQTWLAVQHLILIRNQRYDVTRCMYRVTITSRRTSNKRHVIEDTWAKTAHAMSGTNPLNEPAHKYHKTVTKSGTQINGGVHQLKRTTLVFRVSRAYLKRGESLTHSSKSTVILGRRVNF